MMRFLYECKSILYCFILYSKNSVFPIQSSMNVFYAITICIYCCPINAKSRFEPIAVQ